MSHMLIHVQRAGSARIGCVRPATGDGHAPAASGFPVAGRALARFANVSTLSKFAPAAAAPSPGGALGSPKCAVLALEMQPNSAA